MFCTCILPGSSMTVFPMTTSSTAWRFESGLSADVRRSGRLLGGADGALKETNTMRNTCRSMNSRCSTWYWTILIYKGTACTRCRILYHETKVLLAIICEKRLMVFVCPIKSGFSKKKRKHDYPSTTPSPSAHTPPRTVFFFQNPLNFCDIVFGNCLGFFM